MAEHPKHVVRLASTPTEREASIIVAALDECGICATMSGQYIACLRAGAWGWVQVLVAEEDLPRAQEVLANIRDEQRDIDWSQVDVGESEEPAHQPYAARRWLWGTIVAITVVAGLALWLVGMASNLLW